MSRCHEWNSAFEGMMNYINKKGVKTNQHNSKVERQIVNDYCKKNKIEGSFSTRVLKVSENFGSFAKHVQSLTPNTPTNE